MPGRVSLKLIYVARRREVRDNVGFPKAPLLAFTSKRSRKVTRPSGPWTPRLTATLPMGASLTGGTCAPPLVRVGDHDVQRPPLSPNEVVMHAVCQRGHAKRGLRRLISAKVRPGHRFDDVGTADRRRKRRMNSSGRNVAVLPAPPARSWHRVSQSASREFLRKTALTAR